MNKFFAIFLIGLCLFGTLLPSVRADDGEDDWDDENDRNVSFDASGSSVEFESDDDSLGNQLKFHAEVSGEGLYVNVEYKTSTQVNSTTTESEISFTTLVSFLYEYQESNSMSGYQEGADTLVQSWKLGDQNWSNFDCTSAGTPTVYTCNVQSPVVGATIYVTDGVTDVNGIPLKPSGAKIDLYLVKASSNPIAVALGFKSETEEESDMEVESESDEESEGFTSESEKQLSFGSDAFFSWIETASINGQNISVINSDLINGDSLNEASGEYNYIMFSFDTAEVGTITWDPKAAIGSSVGTSSGAETTVPSVLVMLVAIFAMMY